jgi:DNA-binding response OmpR family regulator
LSFSKKYTKNIHILPLKLYANMKVLIVQSESFLLKLLTDKFQKENYEVVGCTNGLDAIHLFNKSLPDLVVTDLQIPFVSGQELIQYIRVKRDSSVPIIVLSNSTVEENVLSSLQLGANDFVEKPFRVNELILRAKNVLLSNEDTSYLVRQKVASFFSKNQNINFYKAAPAMA